jgi:hypothetical protein
MYKASTNKVINIIIKVILIIIITNHPSKHIKTYYEVTAMSKRPLLSESVVAIQIGIHPTEEEPNQHIVRVAPRITRITTIHNVHNGSKLGPCSRDEVLAPNDRPSRPSS